MTPVSVYVTFAGTKEAKKVAQSLIAQKLIACANIFPCESVYLWKGETEETTEAVAVFKTVREKYSRVEEEIKKRSSYESPAIYVLKVDQVSVETLNWMADVLWK